MIEFVGLTKTFGARRAVDEVSLRVCPGRVTALLGPNGAGKSTLMRVLVGLSAPSSGQALIGGREYRAVRDPSRVVGAHLTSRAVHPGRRARAHLTTLARASGLGVERVEEVLAEVGLRAVAGRRVGTFSLGMAQRLGIAAALLGDPDVLVLDEPVNGLDSDGVRWVRGLVWDCAARGATVLISSHLLSEVELIADQVVVMAGGRVVADDSMASMLARTRQVLVRALDAVGRERLCRALEADGLGWTGEGDVVRVVGADPERVGRLAASAGVPVLLLQAVDAGLEQAYLDLVGGREEFVAGAAAGEGLRDAS